MATAILSSCLIKMSWSMTLTFVAIASLLMDYTLAVCQWQVEVARQDKPFTRSAFVQDRQPLVSMSEFLSNISVANMGSSDAMDYLSYPYLLYLQVYCNGYPSPSVGRTVAASGINPTVTLTYSEQSFEGSCSNVLEYTLRGALVSTNDSNPLAVLSNPAWLVPLLFNSHTRSIPICVRTGSTGYDVEPKRHTISLDGFHEVHPNGSQDSTSVLGTKVPMENISRKLLAGRPYQVGPIASSTPTNVFGAGIPDSSAVILSNDDLMSFEALQISLPDEDDNLCTSLPVSGPLIKHVLTLPDRILFSTISGLYEAFGQYQDTTMPAGMLRNTPARCYEWMMAPTQSRTAEVYILALGKSDDKQKVFAARVQSGMMLDFQELLDDSGGGVCSVLNQTESTSCEIVSGTVSGTKDQEFLLLLKGDSSYYIVTYNGGTPSRQWTVLRNFSSSQLANEGTGDNEVILNAVEQAESLVDRETIPLHLRGVTFSGIISSQLFLWGRKLLYSPNAGECLQVISEYTSDSNITLLTFTHGTGFAFMNEQHEVWYGVAAETVVLKLLRPSSGYSLYSFLGGQITPSDFHEEEQTLGIFFDADNQLQEIIATVNNSTEKLTIIKRGLEVADIIEHEEWLLRKEELRQDDTGSFEMPPPCPFEVLRFEFTNIQPYSRLKQYKLEAPYVSFNDRLHTAESLKVYQAIVHVMKSLDENAPLEVNELTRFDPVNAWRQSKLPLMPYNDYIFRNHLLESQIAISPLEYLKLNDDIDVEATSVMPEEIFLDRCETFRFAVYLTATIAQGNGTSSLDDLRLSVLVSDNNLLQVSTNREVFHLNNSVKYQVDLADRGNLGSQSVPGVGLRPVSVTFNVWNSPFNCFTHDVYSGNQLQGTKSLSVQLGCPSGRHLVFDVDGTFQQLRTSYASIYDCPIPDPKYPCFYYKQEFSPVFRLLDLATGRSSLFTGQYSMIVIGGSVDNPTNAEYFNNQQIAQYNVQNGAH
ncbi:cation channel sperm-associated protein subunit gamma 1-like isoform X2 [Asterias amurensis]|uniref:cation channel sperm-associated protein subunit gamma 1-like isoform X2 n=1 Tax=Asterias amurensis TaxID=7602 RepID=UPI003AB5498D